MSKSDAIKLSDFTLEPKFSAAFPTAIAGTELTFMQLVARRDRGSPILESTFKSLLLAATVCDAYAQKCGSELSKKRSRENYLFYFNQIDIAKGDALALFLYDVSLWEQ